MQRYSYKTSISTSVKIWKWYQYTELAQEAHKVILAYVNIDQTPLAQSGIPFPSGTS